ncbi:MAG: carboxypeptidase regulatory-like domain-containing protein [Acidobacteria bacterium]|nr:carboxypeptidase regulatory-like domain-containing protein [Acidobacteriota bacterium]
MQTITSLISRRAALAVLLSGWLWALPLHAETSRGTVSELVSDATGAVIPNAAITLTNAQTGVTRTTMSNGKGLYRLDAVDLGTHTVKRTAPSFNTVSKSKVTVSANQMAQIDATLTPGMQEMAVGAITGHTNPDANNVPIDPATARYIVNPTYTTGLVGSVVRTGNLGRNTERSPKTNNWNVNFLKRTRLSEGKVLEFRAEFFNPFNHPQYTQGSISPFSPGGGTVGSNAGTDVAGRFLNPNTPNSDGGGRVVRSSVKLFF